MSSSDYSVGFLTVNVTVLESDGAAVVDVGVINEAPLVTEILLDLITLPGTGEHAVSPLVAIIFIEVQGRS